MHNKANCECDLGVILDSNLLFDNHIDEAVMMSNQILGIIKKTFTFLDKIVLISLQKRFCQATFGIW